MQKPRIALVATNKVSPNEHAVLQNLGKMVGDVFELHLLCGKNGNTEGLERFYDIHRGRVFKKDPGGFLYAFSVCSSWISQIAPRLLINVCSPATVGLAVVFFARKNEIPCLVRMTGDSFQEARLRQPPLKRLKSWILHGQLAKLAYKKADHVLAIGENLKESLINHGFAPDKISVLPQPFDKGLFSPVDEDEKIKIKKELGLKTDRKTVLFAGRLSWLKGADRIVKTIEMVGRESNGFQFCLLGQGEYEAALKRFPAELVFLAGLVPRAKIFKYFQAADLLIFPSRTEGLPNTILEALSCRVPVIAAPVGDIGNWVSNIATEPEEYANYILKGDYTLDMLPETLEFENLKEAYRNLFHRIINEK